MSEVADVEQVEVAPEYIGEEGEYTDPGFNSTSRRHQRRAS